jgi:MerR family transcriptional regulator, light-induced transcriptional regulator
MYTIKEAALRAGLTVPVLRAWERRYGIVTPARTKSGYRLFDDAAIARVRAMRRLVDGGMSPSAAAVSIMSGAQPVPATLQPPINVDHEAALFAERFVSGAAAYDLSRVEAVLDEMFASGSFERVADTALLPALQALGDAWADGRLDVAAEHAASHSVLRRLSAFYQAAGRPAEENGVILVGLPPGSRHELGGLAFAVAARRAGLPILYVGPDLPIQDWVGVAVRTVARAAVVGVVTPADREPAKRVTAALFAARPDLLVAYGGRHAPGDASATIESSGPNRSFRLPDGLTDSVDALAQAIGFALGR